MGVPLSTIWTQYFPPAATLTEKNLPTQEGKVFIVTGGNSGVGFELCQMLYASGGTVYLAARNQNAADSAIERIRSRCDTSQSRTGGLHFLHLDVADLSSAQRAAEEFKTKEKKLHVLFNNAGASILPVGAVSKQGIELTTATNCVGAFLLTQLLLPELGKAAKETVDDSARVIWTSSILTEMQAPKGGVDMSTINMPPAKLARGTQYSATKAGNWYLASEFARRHTDRTGVISLTVNPGNLKTNVWRNVDWIVYALVSWTLYESIDGARAAAWAGLWPGITKKDSGRYVIPWGRWHPGQRQDIADGVKSKDEGGTGRAAQFWEWCLEQCREYM